MSNTPNEIKPNKYKGACLIDIDGVVWHGGTPFPTSRRALELLNENDIPYIFVTNGTDTPSSIAKKITDVLGGLPVSNEQVIVAPSPCIGLTSYHEKRVLLCTQDDGIALARELGFSNFTTIPEIIETFPDHDYIDHERRKIKFDQDKIFQLQEAFKPIEVIVLLGEPVKWEGCLQIIIDLLMTNGDPRKHDPNARSVPYPHIPVLACNKDLTFKASASLPRFGHGAFLECLEYLYQRITKNELKYEYLMGKPYIITYKFANSVLRKLNHKRRFDKYYIIGDNPDVDIKGAHIYDAYLQRKNEKDCTFKAPKIESILVCTGVYNPVKGFGEHRQRRITESSEDDELNSTIKVNVKVLTKPDIIVKDIFDAVNHIIRDMKGITSDSDIEENEP